MIKCTTLTAGCKKLYKSRIVVMPNFNILFHTFASFRTSLLGTPVLKLVVFLFVDNINTNSDTGRTYSSYSYILDCKFRERTCLKRPDGLYIL